MADVERFAEMEGFHVGTEGYENNTAHTTLEFNHRNPALADVRVRRAIHHGLDIDEAIETIMRGFAKPGRGPVPSTGGVNYTDEVTTYPYDPDKAKALLDEAGLEPDEDGVRLRLRHRPAPWGEYTQLWGEYFAQAMKEIGIEVTLLTNDAPGFLNGVYRDFDFDTANGWHQFRNDPAVSTMVWLRSGAPVGTPWTNQFGYVDEALDAAIDAAASELDPDDARGDVPRHPAHRDGGSAGDLRHRAPVHLGHQRGAREPPQHAALDLVVVVRPVDRSVAVRSRQRSRQRGTSGRRRSVRCRS